jgi:hypothetical protein
VVTVKLGNRGQPVSVEGFPNRLKQHPAFQFMSILKVITWLFGPGKEAFEMARMRLFEKLLRGVQGGSFLEKSPPGRRGHY